MAHAGKTYHVSLNDDGKWQVKAEKASKALRLFDTQRQAIAYAETIAENQDGKIRRQDYSKK